MATGIVAISCHLEEIPVAPEALGVLNWIAFCALAVLTLIRIARFRGPLMRDLSDSVRGPGFLTTAAGASVLGVQTLLIERLPAVSFALWLLAALLWALILYAFLVAVAVRNGGPPAPAINGGWLLATVATDSIVVLGGALFAAPAAAPPPALQFALPAMFLASLMLYGMIITLIFQRVSFFPLAPQDFGPLYWIDSGAASISALAGSTLILRTADWPALAIYLPFLRGVTLFVWAAASFWIPFLVAMTAWRYGVRRDRFRYEPGLWGMVFPIGMYAAATFTFARANGLPFLHPLARGFAFAGLAAWLIVAAAWLVSLLPRKAPRHA